MRPLSPPFKRSPSLPLVLRDDSGAALVEFAIALALFLLIVFGLFDFGRLGYTWVMAEKAMQRAARIAAVRPPVCPGVPETNERNADATLTPRFGSACSMTDGSGTSVCAASTVSCLGNAATASSPGEAAASEIWAAIQGLMPAGTTIGNVRFRYESDPDLGFLGGPYVPVVTAELDSVTFDFIHPLAGLAALAGATGGGLGPQISVPAMSVSLPGEDLAQGNSG